MRGSLRPRDFADAMRAEFREADFTLWQLLQWTGAAFASAAVVAASLYLIDHAPARLLAPFCLGVIMMVLGSMLLRIDRKAGRARNWAREVVDDYKRRVQLVLELRRMADVLADQHMTLREWAQLIQTSQTARDQFHLDTWIESLRGLAEGSASLVADAGFADLAARYRMRTDAEGHLIPPAAIDQESLESLNDLLNATAQYRQALTSLAVERLGEE